MGELLGRRFFLTYGNCLKRVEEVVDLMKDDLCALGEAESIVLLLRKVRNLGPSLAELWRKLVVRDVRQLLSEMESIVASPEPLNDREKMGYLSRKLFSLSRDAFYYGLNLNEEVVLKELFSSVREAVGEEGRKGLRPEDMESLKTRIQEARRAIEALEGPLPYVSEIKVALLEALSVSEELSQSPCGLLNTHVEELREELSSLLEVMEELSKEE